MKLVYITAQKYPSKKVEPFYMKSLAAGFQEVLGKDFLFFVRGEIPEMLGGLNVGSVNLPKTFRRGSYFAAVPFLVLRKHWNSSDVIFFSSDPYILSSLIFWRKVFRFNYKICSDWHQLFNDWRDRYVARGSDFLATTSARLKDLLVRNAGAKHERIVVGYGGVDLGEFKKQKIKGKNELRKELGLPAGAFLVGYIGGFKTLGTMEKGIGTMIKSLMSLDKKIQMVFVGGSKQEIEDYEKLACELNVVDGCIFVEKQPFEKVVQYECAMDALVIPYPNKPHFAEYGFPLKVWEYMAADRPIIYSNLPVIAEVLEEVGVPFMPDDSASLARAVETVVNGMPGNSEDTNAEKYTWRNRAQTIVQFLHHE